MSPLVVRRYRAERLLRDEFEALRQKVLGAVAGRLRGRGVRLDPGDLDACYSQAWQGLYATVLDGHLIDNPAAWLTLVTYRRAIDEHRSRRAIASEPLRRRDAVDGAELVVSSGERAAGEHDIAAELDDRARLRQLFEALRERQAATLCYLQGLSRGDAAARMGVSESRMRKLMEGRGAGSPGVAAKVGALVQTVGAGEWCEEQGSLMRGLAYGILDPDGERYHLAMLHRQACPACRAYVLSLRGLAAVLPPVPALLHWVLGAGAAGGAVAGAGAGAGGGACGAGAAAGPGGVAAGATGASGAAGAGPLGALGGGALSASGAAGFGAAGGSWWLAGSLGAKVAVGCLLALGVGAGCVALESRSGHARAPEHRASARRAVRARGSSNGLDASLASSRWTPANAQATAAGSSAKAGSHISAPARASREFGPEQPAGSASSNSRTESIARAASASSTAAPLPSPEGQPTGGSSASGSSSGGVPAAQREFSPG
ncbi:MAG TPA: sigma-70 family RNA polymerase sigma factor [Solirubrobacteraceae bacterium]|nr:sigma-70 family RNA polymerase sigma factor [Solirubrobacteraceae bacterium]